MPTAAAAKPASGVQCIYEAMGREEREIAIVMLVDALASNLSKAMSGAASDEVELLLEKGHLQCLDYYPWVSGHSGSASEYASARLLRDAFADFIYMSGHSPEAAASYYQANLAALRNVETPDDIDLMSLQTHLEKSGWDVKERPELANMAALFVFSSAFMDRLDRDFRRGVYYGNAY